MHKRSLTPCQCTKNVSYLDLSLLPPLCCPVLFLPLPLPCPPPPPLIRGYLKCFKRCCDVHLVECEWGYSRQVQEKVSSLRSLEPRPCAAKNIPWYHTWHTLRPSRGTPLNRSVKLEMYVRCSVSYHTLKYFAEGEESPSSIKSRECRKKRVLASAERTLSRGFPTATRSFRS